MSELWDAAWGLARDKLAEAGDDSEGEGEDKPSGLRITITTGNDAFGETVATMASEVARILRDLAKRCDAAGECGCGEDLPTVIRDANGNRVGSIDWED